MKQKELKNMKNLRRVHASSHAPAETDRFSRHRGAHFQNGAPL